MRITSRSNERVKYLKKFHEKKHRDQENGFLAEGFKVIEEALQAGWEVRMLLYTPDVLRHPRGVALLDKAHATGTIELWECEKQVLAAVADTKTPQGALALIAKPEHSLDVLLQGRGTPLVVVLDGLQDPGNLGTIIRTADACELQGVITLEGTVDLFHPKVVRASAGALFHLPAFADLAASTVVEFFTGSGVQKFVADPRGEYSLYECDFSRPTALFMGNEARGCGEMLHAAADRVVAIPMPGQAESLNVGVAASLFIYEAVRQRLKSSLSLP